VTSAKHDWLEAFVRDRGGVAGAVNVLAETGELHLAAAMNIPDEVQEVVRRIPKGKGIARSPQVA
jgi:hypothetical protein